jgi:hypothetical protein
VGLNGEKATTVGEPVTVRVIGDELLSINLLDCAVRRAVFASFVYAVVGVAIVLATVETRKFEI